MGVSLGRALQEILKGLRQTTLGCIRRGQSGERQSGGRALQNLSVQPITAPLLSRSPIFAGRGGLRHIQLPSLPSDMHCA